MFAAFAVSLFVGAGFDPEKIMEPIVGTVLAACIGLSG